MANLKNARYVALTTRGSGWWVVVAGEAGESRETVEERASRDICGDNWDKAKTIEQDTDLKNLQVLSYSAAKRAFPQAISHYEYGVEVGLEQ